MMNRLDQIDRVMGELAALHYWLQRSKRGQTKCDPLMLLMGQLDWHVTNTLGNIWFDLSGALRIRKPVTCPCEFCTGVRLANLRKAGL